MLIEGLTHLSYSFSSSDQARAITAKAKIVGRIPKKWSWTGDLFLDQRDGRELCCPVSLIDVVDAKNATSESLKLSYCFTSTVSFRVTRVHSISNMDAIMLGCQNPSQFAKMIAKDDASQELEVLARYMHRNRSVSSRALSALHLFKIFLSVYTSAALFCRCVGWPHGHVPDREP